MIYTVHYTLHCALHLCITSVKHCKSCFTCVKRNLQNLFFLKQAYGQVRSFFLRKTNNLPHSDVHVDQFLRISHRSLKFYNFNSMTIPLCVEKKVEGEKRPHFFIVGFCSPVDLKNWDKKGIRNYSQVNYS